MNFLFFFLNAPFNGLLMVTVLRIGAKKGPMLLPLLWSSFIYILILFWWRFNPALTSSVLVTQTYMLLFFQFKILVYNY